MPVRRIATALAAKPAAHVMVSRSNSSTVSGMVKSSAHVALAKCLPTVGGRTCAADTVGSAPNVPLWVADLATKIKTFTISVCSQSFQKHLNKETGLN